METAVSSSRNIKWGRGGLFDIGCEEKTLVMKCENPQNYSVANHLKQITLLIVIFLNWMFLVQLQKRDAILTMTENTTFMFDTRKSLLADSSVLDSKIIENSKENVFTPDASDCKGNVDFYFSVFFPPHCTFQASGSFCMCLVYGM